MIFLWLYLIGAFITVVAGIGMQGHSDEKGRYLRDINEHIVLFFIMLFWALIWPATWLYCIPRFIGTKAAEGKLNNFLSKFFLGAVILLACLLFLYSIAGPSK